MFLACLSPHLHFITGCGKTQLIFFFLYSVFGIIESELWRLSEKFVQVGALSFTSGQYPFFFAVSGIGHTADEKVQCVVLFCGWVWGISWLFLELFWVS